jgi:DNA-binding IclR family transcriptional regulator
MQAMARAAVNRRTAKRPAAPRPVAAVARACVLLDAFRTGPAVIGLAELAERTGLYKSTVLRLAGTLEQYRLLQKSPDGRFQVGAATFQLAKRYQSTMTPESVVLPILKALVEQTRESAGFHVVLGSQRMCLCQVDSPQRLRSHFKPGDILPLGRGAGGRALSRFAAGAPAAASQRPDLVIAAVNEVSDGMTGMACPVFDANGSLAGVISISGPTLRFSRAAMSRFESHLIEAARRATLALGGDASLYGRQRRKTQGITEPASSRA